MRAVLCHHFGEPETLVIGSVEPPPLRPSEVRIATRAAGVNFPDLIMVQGRYQLKPPFPFTPGLEIAGEVVEIGADVASIVPGDRVMARLDLGGFAEFVNAPVSRVVKMPNAMSYEDGAAFLVTYGTSFHALVDRAHLKIGETLLVLGATGGVGLTAVELGKCMGATVIAAGGSDAKLETATRYGADHLINYNRENIRDRVKALTGGVGADVIYDPVGGDATDAAARSMNWGARLLIVGFASGRIADIPANRCLIKGSSVVGVLWGDYAARFPDAAGQIYRDLVGLYERGLLKPCIAACYPLAEVATALRSLAARSVVGKVILTI